MLAIFAARSARYPVASCSDARSVLPGGSLAADADDPITTPVPGLYGARPPSGHSWAISWRTRRSASVSSWMSVAMRSSSGAVVG